MEEYPWRKEESNESSVVSENNAMIVESDKGSAAADAIANAHVEAGNSSIENLHVALKMRVVGVNLSRESYLELIVTINNMKGVIKQVNRMSRESN